MLSLSRKISMARGPLVNRSAAPLLTELFLSKLNFTATVYTWLCANEPHMTGLPRPPFPPYSTQEKWGIFERWMNVYKRKYKTEEEKMQRFGFFEISMQCLNRRALNFPSLPLGLGCRSDREIIFVRGGEKLERIPGRVPRGFRFRTQKLPQYK